MKVKIGIYQCSLFSIFPFFLIIFKVKNLFLTRTKLGVDNMYACVLLLRCMSGILVSCMQKFFLGFSMDLSSSIQHENVGFININSGENVNTSKIEAKN